MKKIIVLVVAMFGVISLASAQTFAKGDQVVGVSVGLGSGYGMPLTVNYENAVYDINSTMSIGVGGVLGAASESETLAAVPGLMSGYKVTTSNILVALRGAWHYTNVTNFDLYAGLTMGYDIASASVSGDNIPDGYDAAATSGLLFGAHIGARYYFTENIGINAEAGFGLATLNLGVCYKF